MNELIRYDQASYNSYCPIEYGPEGNIANINKLSEEEVSKMLQDLEKSIISWCNSEIDEKMKNINEMKIIDNYKNYNCVPEIGDLFQDAMSENFEIIQLIAAIDYANNYTEDYDEHDWTYEDTDEEKLQYIRDCWSESFDFEHFSNLEDYIEVVLDNYKMSYYKDMWGGLFTMFDKMTGGAKIIYNDCQNMINKEFMVIGLEDLSAYIDVERADVVMKDE